MSMNSSKSLGKSWGVTSALGAQSQSQPQQTTQPPKPVREIGPLHAQALAKKKEGELLLIYI
jgi:hypothetical protein